MASSTDITLDVDKVSASILRKKTKLILLETDLKSFTKKVATTESDISQKFDQLIALIQSHKSQLMEELKSFEDKILKNIDTGKGDIKTQIITGEYFKRRCQEILKNGTSSDISRMAPDLHARAEELVKTQDEPNCHQLSGVKITFTPAVVITAASVKNYIGQLTFNGQSYVYLS